jgi:hypothetical protein
MMRARCIGEGVRAVYPGALGGMRLSEEMYDADMNVVPDFDDAQAKPEIQMPKAKAPPAVDVDPKTGVIETPVTAKQADAPVFTAGVAEDTFEGTATEKPPAPPAPPRVRSRSARRWHFATKSTSAPRCNARQRARPRRAAARFSA